MLFVPPSMPFMDPVPEAEAAHSSNLQDAITDLSLVSVVDYDPPFSSAIRNKITLSWSAPNDNGSPITYYVVQAKGTSGNWVKLDHMESTVTTYTHTTLVNVQIQYRVWAVGPDGCHGNTTTYYDTLPCNEGNILSVVSAYGGGILPPKAECDNELLDECGYFPPEYYEANLSFESLNITSSSGGMVTLLGDTIQITPTVKWDFGEGTGIICPCQLNYDVHGEIKFPDGTIWTGINYSSVDITTESGTITLNTWNEQLYSSGIPDGTGNPWPVGEYTVTFTADSGNTISTASGLAVLSNIGAITGTFTVAAPADTTPPVVTVPSNQNLIATPPPSSQSSTMHLAMFDWTPTATDDVGVSSINCDYGSAYLGGIADGHYYISFPVGTTTVTCTATDHAGNVGTASFTVTVVLETAEPSAPPVSYTAAEQECLSSANLSTTEKLYTVVTCENPFNVTVNMGQRLHIQNPNGGSQDMLPAATYNGEPGTYTYSQSGLSGTITLLQGASQNQPHATTNLLATMWGSNSQPGNKVDFEMGVKNTNSFSVKDLYVYWQMTYSGDYVGSWQKFGSYNGAAYSATLLPGETKIYNDVGSCCLYSDYNDATPYIVQAFHADGTQLVKPNVYPGTWTTADTTPPEHIALEQFMDDFITATAYVNSTSPTGRTLTVINDRISSDQFGTLGSGDIGLDFKIKKGGTTVYDHAGVYRSDYWASYATWNTHSWSIPIPDGTYYSDLGYPSTGLYTNWTAGTYTIIWDWATPSWEPTFSGSDSFTFTVPAPPGGGDTTPPTINFFVNSPLGTVSIQPVAGGGFERLAYIASDSSGYYLKLYVDVSDDTSGDWLNQNASTCQVSGLTQEQETDSFNNGELIDMNIRDEDGQIIAGNNPMLLSSGPLNGNSGSGDYHYYQFPINGFEQGNIDYNDYYLIHCKATDPAGNFMAQSFLLTVIPESGQTEKPCWSDYCDNIVGTTTAPPADTTPPDDTTPPVINFGDCIGQYCWGFNENDVLTRTALNSTGYSLRWNVNFYDAGDTTVNTPTCYVNLLPVMPIHGMNAINSHTSINHLVPPPTQYGAYEYNHLFPMTSPGGGHTVLCEIDDDAGNHTEASFVVFVVPDTTPPAETPAILCGTASGTSSWCQYSSNEFTGNTPKILVFFMQEVPTVGETVTVIPVFPNAQPNLPLQCPGNYVACLNIPYTLTYPGGTQEGFVISMNTFNHYDMVFQFVPTVAGHYVFQTDLISTSFDVCCTSTPADTTLPEHVALEQFMDDFMTATAYVNSTSPTGRTLTVINDRISSDQFVTFGGDNFGLDFKIKKGGTTVYDHYGVYREAYWHHSSTWNTHSWSIPIPDGTYYVGLGFPPTGLYTNWTAGTYTIIWDWGITNLDNSVFSGSDSSTFTVPAPPAGGDTTPPTFTNLPPTYSDSWPQYWYASNSTGYNVTFNPYFLSDDVGVTSGPTCSPSSGFLFPVGTTTVTCTASDAAGNVGTVSFTVTVIGPTIVQNALGSSTPGCEDTSSCFTPYQATIPVGSTVLWENVDNAAHTVTSGTPTTGVGPSGHFDSELMMAGGASFSHTFDEEGTWYYFCMVHPWMIGKVVVGDGTPIQTAVPVGAEEAEASLDITPPVVTVPSNLTGSTSNSAGKTMTFTVTASDDVGVTSGPTCSPSSGYNFSVGTTTVTCTASDAAGNTGAGTFTVTVILEDLLDTTPPNLVVSNNMPGIQTGNPNGKNVYYASPSATDNVGVMIGPTCTPESGQFFPIGTTTVTCTAYDAAGNKTVKSFTVTVVYSVQADTTQPVFMHVDDVEIYTTNPDGRTYDYAAPQVSDNIGVTTGPTCTPESGSTFPIGITIVACMASDAAGNQGGTAFSVTVINPNATGGIPTFEPVDDIGPLEADVPNGKQLYFSIPTATDDETELPSVFCTPSPGYLFPVGVTTVACTAIDEDGNQGAVSFTVTITSQTQQQASDQTAETSITIVDAFTLDGNSVDEVVAGGLAYFTTSLVTNSTGNAFITVYVQDAGSTALGVVHFKSVIGVGDSDLTLAIRIPSDAISGDANIYVNVWADEMMEVPITEGFDASIQIIGFDPTDLGAFNYWFEGLPDVYSSPPGFSAADVVNDATSYWKGSPPVDTFIPWSGVNSYANSKVPFGDDFVTDLTLNQVDYNSANLSIYWVKEYGGGTLGIAPISDYSDLQEDVIYMSLGDSDFYGTWQPYSEKYLAETLKHEMGHVIGFGHDDEDPQTNPDNLMNSAAPGQEYGIVEQTFTLTGGYGQQMLAFTSRDATNFNYHVSTDNEAGFNVYFVPDLDTAMDQFLSIEQVDSYPGCFVEDVMSTGAQSCNNVEMGSGLFITIPFTDETTGILTDVTVKLQENFDGIQTLSNVAATQEAPIMTTAVQSTKLELLEVFEAEAEYESVFLDGTDYLEITDTTLTQDIDEFSIVGWIKPDFSIGSNAFTIISKDNSFALYLEKESFRFQGGHTIIVPNRTLNLSLYDGVEWYTIPGNTGLSEGWHHIAVVVDGSVAKLYLDTKIEGKMKLEKKVTLGTQDAIRSCPESECFVDTKMSVSDADLVIGAYISKMMVTNQYGLLEPKRTVENIFSGGVSSVEIFRDAFTAKQVFGLYERDKNYYQRDSATDIATIGSESPALSDSECLDLAKERGLYVYSKPITVVCQFPFNVVIPLNSSILWMETLPSYGGPYHTIRSVDDLFETGAASFALMDFYEPNFTYGVYEYFDGLSGSLTGKIIIAQPLLAEEIGKNWNSATQSFFVEPIKIARHSAGPDCVIDDSCYEPFAVSVDVREEVTWKNTDGFSHSVTSGTPEDGPDGVFDSGLIPPMHYFSHTFSAAGDKDFGSWRGEGIYDYYCTFHPWMKGMVVVGEI